MEKHPSNTLRLMLASLTMLYMVAIYLQWHPPKVSLEANQYDALVQTSMSGLSWSFALEKVFWALGNVVGVASVTALFLGKRAGLVLILVCPLLLSAAALTGASPAAYPETFEITTILVWCACSAIWGCTVMYAFVHRTRLF